MAMFNEQQFEKKLLTLKDTQENISSLSSWCLQHPQHHKKIVTLWLQVLKKVKIEQRLTLFYLANDVIQYSKRKGYDFVESWGTALQKATTLVRDDKVKNKILRLFKIWDERSIYDEAFLVDLSGLLSSRAASNNQDAQDFQPASLISKIRSCKTLEDETDLSLKLVNEFPLSLSDTDALMNSLKERRHSADVEQEVDEGLIKMNNYITSLKNELEERRQLIELLDLSEAFYENQRGEAKIVCNAYRNFGNRVKGLKRKLDDLILTLPSPIPSPDVNAPSPSPESDIDLPEDNLSDKAYSHEMGTFIGKLVVPDKIKISDSNVYSIDSSEDFSNSRPETPLRPYQPPTPPRSYKRKTAKPSSTHSRKEAYEPSSHSRSEAYEPTTHSRSEVYEPEFPTSTEYPTTYQSAAPIPTSYDPTPFSSVEKYTDSSPPIPPYVPPPMLTKPTYNIPVPPNSPPYVPPLTTAYTPSTTPDYSTSTYSSKTPQYSSTTSFDPKTTSSYNTTVYPPTTSPSYSTTNSVYPPKSATPPYLTNSVYPPKLATPPYVSNSVYPPKSKTPPYLSANSGYPAKSTSPLYPPTTYPSKTSPYSSQQSNNFNPTSESSFFSQNNSYPPKQSYESSPTFPVTDYSVPPPKPGYISPTPLPFSYSSSNIMPPLLGEDFPINGMDISLPPDISSFSDEPSPESSFLTGGFSSFMGNPDLQFQLQKELFSDTPASPTPEDLLDERSPLNNYHSDSSPDTPIEGKPIEVISKSTPTNIADILKALGMNTGRSLSSDSTGESMAQMNTMDDVYLDDNGEDKTWNHPPLLPPKFPTWGQSNWNDTPVSPPFFDKYGDPSEYDDADSLVLTEEDTDLRTLSLAHGPHGDIDHRNLISLTGSPRNDTPWTQTQDTDYRRMALSTKPVVPVDNVESVDMEMSSEEELEGSVPDTTKTSTSVSFSLSSAAKPLPESPLIEKEELKTTALPRLDTDTPPPETTVLKPPPLPSADMFSEVENSDDKEQKKLDPSDLETPVVVKDSPLTVPVLQSNPQSVIPLPPRFVGPSRPRLPMNRPRYPQWRGNMRGQHILPPPPPPPPMPIQNMRGPPFGGPRFRPPFDSQAFRGRPLFRGQRWPQRFNSW